MVHKNRVVSEQPSLKKSKPSDQFPFVKSRLLLGVFLISPFTNYKDLNIEPVVSLVNTGYAKISLQITLTSKSFDRKEAHYLNSFRHNTKVLG